MNLFESKKSEDWIQKNNGSNENHKTEVTVNLREQNHIKQEKQFCEKKKSIRSDIIVYQFKTRKQQKKLKAASKCNVKRQTSHNNSSIFIIFSEKRAILPKLICISGRYHPPRDRFNICTQLSSPQKAAHYGWQGCFPKKQFIGTARHIL